MFIQEQENTSSAFWRHNDSSAIPVMSCTRLALFRIKKLENRAYQSRCRKPPSFWKARQARRRCLHGGRGKRTPVWLCSAAAGKGDRGRARARRRRQRPSLLRTRPRSFFLPPSLLRSVVGRSVGGRDRGECWRAPPPDRGDPSFVFRCSFVFSTF